MDAVEEVKSRLNIEDVVGEYVQLKRAGRNFKGLSPFGNEKSPSFMVSPEKQIWHDFSSGKGGNMFSFIMEMEGLDFKGALEHLARKAGVDLSLYRSGRSAESSKTKDRLYDALEQAAKFYQVQFSKNNKALEYVFRQRSFSKEIALDFRLGYSPNTGDALLRYLKKQGFSDNELRQSGLVAQRRNGLVDMFRGRLMVPLSDAQGRIVGFTARLLDDIPNAPKYINTPQTMLYDKGRQVFGLYQAKEAIRSHNYVVLVEGNLDVIAAHQAGTRQVVATAGTAMTEMHLKALSRFTSDMRIAFDQDRAGQDATERAIPIAAKVGVNLSVISITGAKDPDELIRSNPEAWEKAINDRQYAVDWLISRYMHITDVKTGQGKREFTDALLAVVKGIQDPVEQDHYVTKLADIIAVDKEALLSKLRAEKRTQGAQLKKAKNTTFVILENPEYRKVQDHFLMLILLWPELRTRMRLVTSDMFNMPEARLFFSYLLAHPDAVITEETLITFDDSMKSFIHAQNTQSDATVPLMQNIEEYGKMLLLQYETLYKDIDSVELGYEVDRLEVRLIEQYVKTQKDRLVNALRDTDEHNTMRLLEQAKALDALLKQTKEMTHG